MPELGRGLSNVCNHLYPLYIESVKRHSSGCIPSSLRTKYFSSVRARQAAWKTPCPGEVLNRSGQNGEPLMSATVPRRRRDRLRIAVAVTTARKVSDLCGRYC